MLASLLTQLLGKVAEAKLMHAKACNLPMWTCCSHLCRCGMCFVVALAASHVFLVYCVVSIGVDTDTSEARWVCSFLPEQDSLMTPPVNTTLFGVQSGLARP